MKDYEIEIEIIIMYIH